MNNLLLCALLLALMPAPARTEGRAPLPPPVQAEAADYKTVLGEALLAGKGLPPAPAEAAALRARAAELALGRPEVKSPAAFEAEVRALAAELGLDAARTARLVELLCARPRAAAPKGGAPERGAEARSMTAEQARALNLSAQAQAKALGISKGDAFAGTAPKPAPVPAPASAEAVRAVPAGPLSRAGLLPAEPVLPMRLKAPPAPDKPLRWDEVERVVDVGEKPTGWKERLQYELAPYITRLDRPEWREQRTTRRALELMQTTPEGREVLRQLVDELGPKAGRPGAKVSVRSEDFGERSSISMHDGVEGILGARGRARYTMDLDLAEYHYSSKYLEFKDGDMATRMLAGNMAHEFRHLVNVAQLKRLSPDQTAPYSVAFVNEQRARQTGYLVAARLNNGKPNDYLDEASSLAQDPEAFWEGIKRGPSYIRSLTPDEMKAPRAAYEARLEALKEDNEELRQDISRGLPRALDALTILSEKEGRARDLAELKTQTAARLRSYPEFLKGGEEQEAHIRTIVSHLDTPKGREWAEALARAGDSTAFRGYQSDYARDEAALRQVLKARPAPQRQRPQGSMTWPQFWEAVRVSREKHPGYWAEFEKKYGKD